MTDPNPDLTRAGTPRRRASRRRRPVTITPDMLEGAPDFAPVPRGHIRYDGGTPTRQRAFVKALAETGSVGRAARWVGMSEVGAYLLRKAAGSEAFAAAWDEALSVGVARLADIAFDRAINGVPVPIFYKGEQVGERRWYNDRLLMFELRHRDPENYGGSVTSPSNVPPHVRKALYAQWERERAEKEAEEERRSGGARERLTAKLQAIRERMGDTPPTGRDSLAVLSAWVLFARAGQVGEPTADDVAAFEAEERE